MTVRDSSLDSWDMLVWFWQAFVGWGFATLIKSIIEGRYRICRFYDNLTYINLSINPYINGKKTAYAIPALYNAFYKSSVRCASGCGFKVLYGLYKCKLCKAPGNFLASVQVNPSFNHLIRDLRALRY